eukprot:CAMPEP_0115280798 /NCGR_PEP_ID=MMETSP0270-20121206/58982_1 /TAXON_ID=71861 /ORGANISM="Scrippsiella trochoidea, Strain CCMP3099" /LENGTH=168 /DNA_ID=CAMNT_0002697563 /DNA_START=306 /DNA_END=812 /DNA_ORIENTATION=-
MIGPTGFYHAPGDWRVGINVCSRPSPEENCIAIHDRTDMVAFDPEFLPLALVTPPGLNGLVFHNCDPSAGPSSQRDLIAGPNLACCPARLLHKEHLPAPLMVPLCVYPPSDICGESIAGALHAQRNGITHLQWNACCSLASLMLRLQQNKTRGGIAPSRYLTRTAEHC